MYSLRLHRYLKFVLGICKATCIMGRTFKHSCLFTFTLHCNQPACCCLNMLAVKFSEQGAGHEVSMCAKLHN